MARILAALLLWHCLSVIQLDFRWIDSSVVLADNTPINPSKIKSNILRMKKLSNKSDLREQNLEISKLFTESKSFLTAPKAVYGQIDPLDPRFKDRPIFEIYIRNKKGGMWLRLKDVACKPEMVVNVALLAEGGSVAEESRESLEREIHSELFGMGMGGDKILHSEVVSVIPQYRKLKLRDMLVGYRQLGLDSKISDNSCIWTLNQMPYSSARNIPSFPSTFILSSSVIEEYIDSISSGRAMDHSDSIYDTISKLNEFSNKISRLSPDKPINLYICSDGSATRYSENIGRYFATAGLVIAAADNNNNILSKMNIQATADGSVVTNPFDAELIGGLLALGVFVSLTRTSSLPCTFLSDSRTLIRVFRQLIESSLSNQENNPSSDKLLRDYVVETTIELKNKFSLLPQLENENLKFRWTAGHPEKRYESLIE